MNYQQLVQPNLNATGTVGMCLSYAEDFLAAPHAEKTATAAWEDVQFRHENTDLPNGIVPLWFSYIKDGVDEGHVAVWVPGRGIYSSPWQEGTTHAVLPNLSELIRIYSDNGQNPMVFLGWSEDISGKRIVMEEDDMVTPQNVQDYVKTYTGADATAKQVQDYTVSPWTRLATDVCDYQYNEIQGLKTALATANAKLAQEAQVATAKPAPLPAVPSDPSVTVTKSGLWAAFLRFMGKG